MVGCALTFFTRYSEPGSPYINRFLQPDTVIPNPANPQSWNRYSYVINNPLRYADPTGNKWDECKEGQSDYQCNRRMQHRVNLMDSWNEEAYEKMLAATIKIGFGWDYDGCVVYGYGGCSFGLGTVVGDRQTIYSAWHVYFADQSASSNFFYATPDGNYHAMSGVTIEHTPGTDVMIIHLSVALGPEFVPAELNPNHYIPRRNDLVRVVYNEDQTRDLRVTPVFVRTDGTYKRGLYDENGFGTSVYNPHDLTVDRTKNAQFTFNHGDSGGGVFYNGYFVGVSSYIRPDEFGEYMVFELP